MTPCTSRWDRARDEARAIRDQVSHDNNRALVLAICSASTARTQALSLACEIGGIQHVPTVRIAAGANGLASFIASLLVQAGIPVVECGDADLVLMEIRREGEASDGT